MTTLQYAAVALCMLGFAPGLLAENWQPVTGAAELQAMFSDITISVVLKDGMRYEGTIKDYIQ